MVSTDNLIAACLLFLTSLIALIAYILILVALFKIYKESKNSFYLLLFAMGLSDASTLALFLFYSTPCTFLGTYFLTETFDIYVGGPLCNISYFTSLFFLMNIALNRYFTICHSTTTSSSKMHTDRRKIALSIVACFGLGVSSSIAQFLPCCSMRYYPDYYSWTYDSNLDGNARFVWFDRSVSTCTFFCLVICYSLIFRKVRKVNKAIQPAFQPTGGNSKEMARNQRVNLKLAIQSAVVSSFYITLDIAFTVIPLITEDKWWFLVISVWNIGAVGVHPIIYLLFNDGVHRQVKRILRCKVEEVQNSTMIRDGSRGQHTGGMSMVSRRSTNVGRS